MPKSEISSTAASLRFTTFRRNTNVCHSKDHPRRTHDHGHQLYRFGAFPFAFSRSAISRSLTVVTFADPDSHSHEHFGHMGGGYPGGLNMMGGGMYPQQYPGWGGKK
uniref:Tes101 n=1 Tax=Panagrellus redivivus TaxID=6233 RepID=A0A7E4UZG8_PANRE